MTYKKSTYYISAYAKLSAEMPSGEIYKYLDMGFIIDMDTDIIEDMSITLVTAETRAFIKDLIVGYNLANGLDGLTDIVKKRFFGSSQKAICVVAKQIYEKYLLLKRDYK